MEVEEKAGKMPAHTRTATACNMRVNRRREEHGVRRRAAQKRPDTEFSRIQRFTRVFGLQSGTILGWAGARDHLDPRPPYGGGRSGGGLGGGACDVRKLWVHDAVRHPDAAKSGEVILNHHF